MGFTELAPQIMSLPTAPYHEHFVSAAVEGFVRQRPQLELSKDDWGNLLILYNPGPSPQSSYLIATAHMDHPGLVFDHRIGSGRFLFRRCGQVDAALAVNSQVALYRLDRPADQRPLNGRLTEIIARDDLAFGFVLEVPEAQQDQVGAGSFAMWDLPPLRRRGPLLYSRACDDLAGLTAGLAYLDQLCQQAPRLKAGLLVTRAEEIGFGGMLAAVKAGYLDRAALYVNLECSSAKAGAVLGDGPIIRVGDRWWVFNHEITGGLVALADEMQQEDGFRFQRKLMDGGICEATVLMQAGYTTGALALALKNYHNNGPKRLSPEAIHIEDAEGLVRLLVRVAQTTGGLEAAFTRARQMLDQRLEQRYEASVQRLRQTYQPD